MDGFMFEVLVIAAVATFAFMVYRSYLNENRRKEAIRSAESAYKRALADLRKDPNNSNKREKALRLGRAYADLVRDDKRTMFDEVAVMNDLNAIQPTAEPKAAKVEKAPVATDSTEQRLAKLDDLKSKGLITEDEYQNRRSAILDQI